MMSKYGNMGNPDKLAAFIKIVTTARNSLDAIRLDFIVEYDPRNRYKFKLTKADLKVLKYNEIDIYLGDKCLCSWWDIVSAAIVYDL